MFTHFSKFCHGWISEACLWKEERGKRETKKTLMLRIEHMLVLIQTPGSCHARTLLFEAGGLSVHQKILLSLLASIDKRG